MAVGGVLFDIDGVLTTSWKPITGAAETLRILNDHQIACSYLTNTTTRTRKQIAEALVDAGMDVHADEVITAALLTSEYVRQTYPDARCFLVNSGDISEDMPGIELVADAELSAESDPYLLDHLLDGDLLFPAVLGMEAWIRSQLPEAWRQRVFVHPLAPNDELASRVSEHDIGFAGEVPYCRNKNLTVSNKVLQYLLGGLAVVASDTAGQRAPGGQRPGPHPASPGRVHPALQQGGDGEGETHIHAGGVPLHRGINKLFQPRKGDDFVELSRDLGF